MKKNQFWQYLVGSIALTLLIPSVVSAHTGVGHPDGFWHGFTHPIGGLDHILAMVAVGLWAAQIGGSAIWLVPTTFAIAMAGSSVLGHLGVPLPGVEQGILASDFVLGLLIVCAARFPLAVSTAIVGVLAIFHGYAHGAEMPATASGLTYGMGFLLATAGLHLLGIAMGWAIDRFEPILRQRLFAASGIAVVTSAVYLIAVA